MSDLKENLLSDDIFSDDYEEDFSEETESKPKEEKVAESKEETPQQEEEIVEGTKPLEVGKTVIGKVNGKVKGEYRELSVLYGNVCSPVIDGEFKHLNERIYMDMLAKFLDSEEGMDYIVPTEEEVNAATLKMLNVEERVKKEIKKPEPEPVVEPTPTPEPIKEEPVDVEPEVDEYNDLLNEEAPKKGPGQILTRNINYKIVSMVLFGLLLLSLVGNALLFNGGGRQPSISESYAEVDINGETYKVPVADLTVEDNHTRFLMYGISIASVDGEIIRKAIPLGEFNFNGLILESVNDSQGNKLNIAKSDEEAKTTETTEEVQQVEEKPEENIEENKEQNVEENQEQSQETGNEEPAG